MVASAHTKLSSPSASSYRSFAECSLPAQFGSDAIKGRDVVQLDSVSSSLVTQSLSRNTEDASHDAPPLLYTLPVIFAAAVTLALVLHIFLCDSLVFRRGVVVSDHGRCTAVGQKVFQDGGSSVDAAVASMLCVGVVHPHATGVGGGGMMLVHDIRGNRTRVIDFQGSAPRAFTERLLKNASELEAGSQVAVPGVLMGLHHAHRLYGRLPWEDVVSRAAEVAREGFNVSHSLAAAIAQVKGERLSQRFMEVFVPHGQALSPGSLLKMPALAEVLLSGLIHFYHGNISQEIEDEVRANGGVLSREDVRSYSAVEHTPREERDGGFIIQVPPPPSAGAVFISALRLLESFPFREIPPRRGPSRFTEALTGSVAAALDGPHSNSSLTELLLLLLSSLSRTFGSRLITPSGVILNSFLLDVATPKNDDTQAPTNPRTKGEGERLESLLTPTLLIPSRDQCGLYVALSSSAVHKSIRVITQILNTAVLLHKKQKDNNGFPEGLLRSLYERGPQVLKGKNGSSVWGLLRNGDVFSAIEGRQWMASLIVSLSW